MGRPRSPLDLVSTTPLVAGIAIGFVTVAVVSDLRSRTVPDWTSVALLLLAALASTIGWHEVGVADAAIGLVLAFALGAAGFYSGAFGGGDAKLLAALGALVGATALLELLLATALAGGVVAWWAKRRGIDTIAYAPAIAVGYALTAAVQLCTPSRGALHALTGASLW